MKILKMGDDSHKELKILAAKAGVTMKEYIANLIKEASDGK